MGSVAYLLSGCSWIKLIIDPTPNPSPRKGRGVPARGWEIFVRGWEIFVDSTSIATINDQSTAGNNIYTIGGQRVAKMGKGIYVVRSANGSMQGKKVMNK